MDAGNAAITVPNAPPSSPLATVNFRTLDLNLLRVFDVVMAERNVTRAAVRLSMSQPAVSNALRRLRDATGDDLFVPGPSGVTPTAQADALWERVRGAIDELRGTFERHSFDPSHDLRSFALAMADATATVLAPSLVAALPEAGAVSMRVLPLDTRDPRPMLDHGVAEAAIGFFPDVSVAIAAEGDGAPFAIDPLYRCRYVCVLRHDHPLAAEGAVLDLDAYASARHVRVNFAGRPRGFVDESLARQGRERRVVLTVNQFATAARVVHDSDLIGVLPLSFVAASGLAGGLVVRPVPLDLPLIDVSLVWHRRHAHDAGHRWMRERVAEVAGRIGARSKPGAPAGRESAPAPLAEPALA